MSNPNPPNPGRASRWRVWFAWIALAGYAAFLTYNTSVVAGGADSSGYLNSARLLASGELTAELRVPPEFGPQEKLRRQQFQPHGFVPFDGNPRLSPTYAVGLPLHLALAGKLLGWDYAPVVVSVAGALAALLLIYLIGRWLQLDAALAATGAVLMAAYPVFVFMSIQPLSDTLAMTWCAAAVYFALRSSASSGWAVACGMALAIAVLVRATNLLLVPALLVLLGTQVRRLALFAAGGFPIALWLGYYNQTLYGSPFRSGYVNISDAFAWTYGAPTFVHFIKWLALLLPSLVLLLPFAVWYRRRVPRRVLVALALWFGTFTGLYAFYEVSHEVWWDLRFILPGTPALILAALLGVQALTSNLKGRVITRAGWIAGGALALWSVGAGVYWTRHFHLLLTKTHEQGYADAADAARAHFPADSLVVAGLHSGALYYYTDFPVLRWEFVDPAEFAAFRAQTATVNRPMGALLFDLEEKEALQEKCPGPWTEISRIKNVSLWKLDTTPLGAVK